MSSKERAGCVCVCEGEWRCVGVYGMKKMGAVKEFLCRLAYDCLCVYVVNGGIKKMDREILRCVTCDCVCMLYEGEGNG